MRYAVLGVDPGKASGVVFVTWTGDVNDNPVLQYSEEASEDEYARYILDGLRQKDAYEVFVVACERFTITARTVSNSQAPYSLEQIGVLKHLCREHGFPVKDIQFQMPADAKNMFPNKTLQKIGIWHKGGEGHANDAIRHALLALAKKKWAPLGILN